MTVTLSNSSTPITDLTSKELIVNCDPVQVALSRDIFVVLFVTLLKSVSTFLSRFRVSRTSWISLRCGFPLTSFACGVANCIPRRLLRSLAKRGCCPLCSCRTLTSQFNRSAVGALLGQETVYVSRFFDCAHVLHFHTLCHLFSSEIKALICALFVVCVVAVHVVVQASAGPWFAVVYLGKFVPAATEEGLSGFCGTIYFSFCVGLLSFDSSPGFFLPLLQDCQSTLGFSVLHMPSFPRSPSRSLSSQKSPPSSFVTNPTLSVLLHFCVYFPCVGRRGASWLQD